MDFHGVNEKGDIDNEIKTKDNIQHKEIVQEKCSIQPQNQSQKSKGRGIRWSKLKLGFKKNVKDPSIQNGKTYIDPSEQKAGYQLEGNEKDIIPCQIADDNCNPLLHEIESPQQELISNKGLTPEQFIKLSNDQPSYLLHTSSNQLRSPTSTACPNKPVLANSSPQSLKCSTPTKSSPYYWKLPKLSSRRFSQLESDSTGEYESSSSSTPQYNRNALLKKLQLRFCTSKLPSKCYTSKNNRSTPDWKGSRPNSRSPYDNYTPYQNSSNHHSSSKYCQSPSNYTPSQHAPCYPSTDRKTSKCNTPSKFFTPPKCCSLHSQHSYQQPKEIVPTGGTSHGKRLDCNDDYLLSLSSTPKEKKNCQHMFCKLMDAVDKVKKETNADSIPNVFLSEETPSFRCDNIQSIASNTNVLVRELRRLLGLLEGIQSYKNPTNSLYSNPQSYNKPPNVRRCSQPQQMYRPHQQATEYQFCYGENVTSDITMEVPCSSHNSTSAVSPCSSCSSMATSSQGSSNRFVAGLPYGHLSNGAGPALFRAGPYCRSRDGPSYCDHTGLGVHQGLCGRGRDVGIEVPKLRCPKPSKKMKGPMLFREHSCCCTEKKSYNNRCCNIIWQAKYVRDHLHQNSFQSLFVNQEPERIYKELRGVLHALEGHQDLLSSWRMRGSKDSIKELLAPRHEINPVETCLSIQIKPDENQNIVYQEHLVPKLKQILDNNYKKLNSQQCQTKLRQNLKQSSSMCYYYHYDRERTLNPCSQRLLSKLLKKLSDCSINTYKPILDALRCASQEIPNKFKSDSINDPIKNKKHTHRTADINYYGVIPSTRCRLRTVNLNKHASSGGVTDRKKYLTDNFSKCGGIIQNKDLRLSLSASSSGHTNLVCCTEQSGKSSRNMLNRESTSRRKNGSMSFEQQWYDSSEKSNEKSCYPSRERERNICSQKYPRKMYSSRSRQEGRSEQELSRINYSQLKIPSNIEELAKLADHDKPKKPRSELRNKYCHSNKIIRSDRNIYEDYVSDLRCKALKLAKLLDVLECQQNVITAKDSRTSAVLKQYIETIRHSIKKILKKNIGYSNGNKEEFQQRTCEEASLVNCASSDVPIKDYFIKTSSIDLKPLQYTRRYTEHIDFPMRRPMLPEPSWPYRYFFGGEENHKSIASMPKFEKISDRCHSSLIDRNPITKISKVKGNENCFRSLPNDTNNRHGKYEDKCSRGSLPNTNTKMIDSTEKHINNCFSNMVVNSGSNEDLRLAFLPQSQDAEVNRKVRKEITEGRSGTIRWSDSSYDVVDKNRAPISPRVHYSDEDEVYYTSTEENEISCQCDLPQTEIPDMSDKDLRESCHGFTYDDLNKIYKRDIIKLKSKLTQVTSGFKFKRNSIETHLVPKKSLSCDIEKTEGKEVKKKECKTEENNEPNKNNKISFGLWFRNKRDKSSRKNASNDFEQNMGRCLKICSKMENEKCGRSSSFDLASCLLTPVALSNLKTSKTKNSDSCYDLLDINYKTRGKSSRFWNKKCKCSDAPLKKKDRKVNSKKKFEMLTKRKPSLDKRSTCSSHSSSGVSLKSSIINAYRPQCVDCDKCRKCGEKVIQYPRKKNKQQCVNCRCEKNKKLEGILKDLNKLCINYDKYRIEGLKSDKNMFERQDSMQRKASLNKLNEGQQQKPSTGKKVDKPVQKDKQDNAKKEVKNYKQTRHQSKGKNIEEPKHYGKKENQAKEDLLELHDVKEAESQTIQAAETQTANEAESQTKKQRDPNDCGCAGANDKTCICIKDSSEEEPIPAGCFCDQQTGFKLSVRKNKNNILCE